MATDESRPPARSQPADPFEACAHCGSRFESGVRYPTTTRRDGDGRIALHAFCDGTCQSAWERTP